MLLIGLAALLVVGLVFGAVGSGIESGQRDAWMEGYTMGRLTAAAGVEGAIAPMVPYAGPYAMGYRGHGPGFGGFLFLLLGAGALFFVGSRIAMRARWKAWAMQGQQGFGPGWGPGGMHPGAGSDSQAQWRQGPPWAQGRGGCGPQQQGPVEQGQVQGAQATAARETPPAAAPEQPSAER
jgi:hypothetical protein